MQDSLPCYPMRRSWLAVAAAVLMVAAACQSKTSGWQMLDTRVVTLPDGFQERAEVKITPEDMARGMMYRDSITDGEGMLFVHGQVGPNAYWMGHCTIPLDIIWMDTEHKVVEISAETPPCPSGGSDCPSYGGHLPSQYVLEIGSGQAARHQVLAGAVLRF